MAGLAAPSTAAAPVPPLISEDVWRQTRVTVLAHINAARAAHGVPPLAPDELLARAGNRHCHDLIEDAVTGHFSRRGTPPYLRYLLAGGTGYHRQNAAALITSARLDEAAIPRALLESIDRMLAEKPPEDGHRTTLLDPTSTHIGIGIAARGGWLASTHEVAVLLAEDVVLPPPVAQPRTLLRYAASLPSPWQPRAVEVLWEPLPTPLTAAQADAITSYRYPPRRAITFLQRGRLGASRPGSDSAASGELAEESRGRFSFRWATGPQEGVEILVVWASRTSTQRDLVAVAAAAVVVTQDGTLPPELGRWVEFRNIGGGPLNAR